VKDINAVSEIYQAAQAQRHRSLHDKNATDARETKPSTSTEAVRAQPCPPSSHTIGDIRDRRHPLEICIEAYCKERLLGDETMSPSAQNVMTAILHVWESTRHVSDQEDRRDLAMMVTENAGSDYDLGCRCLSGIARGVQQSIPDPCVHSMIKIIRESAVDLPKAIVAYTRSLSDGHKSWSTWTWVDLLYAWLERQGRSEAAQGTTLLEYSMKTMKSAEWYAASSYGLHLGQH
jgi:hypothetical protein